MQLLSMCLFIMLCGSLASHNITSCLLVTSLTRSEAQFQRVPLCGCRGNPKRICSFHFQISSVQNLSTKMVKGKDLSQGKEKVTTLYRKRKHKGDRNGDGKRAKVDKVEKAANVVTNVDHLQWKKISLNNDEFEDLEEIEGVDVEYIEKDESKVVQFKVHLTWELN